MPRPKPGKGWFGLLLGTIFFILDLTALFAGEGGRVWDGSQVAWLLIFSILGLVIVAHTDVSD